MKINNPWLLITKTKSSKLSYRTCQVATLCNAQVLITWDVDEFRFFHIYCFHFKAFAKRMESIFIFSSSH